MVDEIGEEKPYFIQPTNQHTIKTEQLWYSTKCNLNIADRIN